MQIQQPYHVMAGEVNLGVHPVGGGGRRPRHQLLLGDLQGFLHDLVRFLVTCQPHQRVGVVLTVQDPVRRYDSSVVGEGRAMVRQGLVELPNPRQAAPDFMVVVSSAGAILVVRWKFRREISPNIQRDPLLLEGLFEPQIDRTPNGQPSV